MIKLGLVLLAGVSTGVVATLAVNESRAPGLETMQLASLEQSLRELDERVEDLEAAGQDAALAAERFWPSDASDRDSAAPGTDSVSETEAAATVVSAGPRRALRRNGEVRRQRMADEGLSAQTIDWIEQREREARWRETQRRWERRRERYLNGEPIDNSVLQTLRAELGERDYEAYRRAVGLPTATTVLSVLDGSPGSTAGLVPGDRIVRYDGQRLYDLADLQRLTFTGQRDETVVVDIERDGMPIQLALPRGPIGISIGGRR